MLEILILILCIWLLVKVMGLLLRMAWGTAKMAASILLTIGTVLLVCCLLFAGGVLILIPAAVLCLAFGILKRCV